MILEFNFNHEFYCIRFIIKTSSIITLEQLIDIGEMPLMIF